MPLAALPLFLAPLWTKHWWGGLVAAPIQLLGVWLVAGQGVPGRPILQPGAVLYAGALAWLAQIAAGPLLLRKKVRFILRLVSVVPLPVRPMLSAMGVVGASSGNHRRRRLGDRYSSSHRARNVLGLGVLLLVAPLVLVQWGAVGTFVIPGLLIVFPVGVMAIVSGIREAEWWQHGWAWPWILPLLAVVMRLAMYTSGPSSYTVWATLLWGVAAVVWALMTFFPWFSYSWIRRGCHRWRWSGCGCRAWHASRGRNFSLRLVD